jgi:hypothetical protein
MEEIESEKDLEIRIRNNLKDLFSDTDFILFENKDDKNHFYIFVYYSNFENVKENPELYVVPATEISAIVKERESVNNVSIVSLREKYSRDFSDAVKIFK